MNIVWSGWKLVRSIKSSLQRVASFFASSISVVVVSLESGLRSMSSEFTLEVKEFELNSEDNGFLL